MQSDMLVIDMITLVVQEGSSAMLRTSATAGLQGIGVHTTKNAERL